MKITGCIIANKRDAMLAKYYNEIKTEIETFIYAKYNINCKICINCDFNCGHNEVKIIDANNCEYYIDLQFQRDLANAYYNAYFSSHKLETKEKQKDALSKMINIISKDIETKQIN